MTRSTSIKKIAKSLEEINEIEIERKIIDNDKMQRLNIPSEILNLGKLSPKFKIELEMDFETGTVVWRPNIKEATFDINLKDE